MGSFKTRIFIFLLGIFTLLSFQNCSQARIFLFPKSSMAFDVGGLVADTDSGGNVSGFSDTGFGGIAGNVDGFSVGDISEAADVGGLSTGSAGGNSAFGGNGFAGDVNGIASDPTDGPTYSEHVSIARSAARIAIEMSDLSDPMKDAVSDMIADDQVVNSMIDSFGKMAVMGYATQDALDGIVAEVEGIIGKYSQFNGQFLGGKIDLSNANIADDSAKLTNRMVKTLKASKMLSPLSRLGMKGTRILVMERLPGSFYAKGLNMIFIKKSDFYRYGATVLLHELLHAGLYKAKKSKTITASEFNRLSDLNISNFGHLNGYVGNAQGAYKKNGYGYQEAFAVGYSYHIVKANLSSISEQIMRDRAQAYLDSIDNNDFLNRTIDGKVIRMLNTGKLSPAEVRQKFLRHFLNKDSSQRTLIAAVEVKVGDQLSNLCAPGTQKFINEQSCRTNEAVYQRSSSYDVRICRPNYRYGQRFHVGCGRVVRYLGK